MGGEPGGVPARTVQPCCGGVLGGSFRPLSTTFHVRGSHHRTITHARARQWTTCNLIPRMPVRVAYCSAMAVQPTAVSPRYMHLTPVVPVSVPMPALTTRHVEPLPHQSSPHKMSYSLEATQLTLREAPHPPNIHPQVLAGHCSPWGPWPPRLTPGLTRSSMRTGGLKGRAGVSKGYLSGPALQAQSKRQGGARPIYTCRETRHDRVTTCTWAKASGMGGTGLRAVSMGCMKAAGSHRTSVGHAPWCLATYPLARCSGAAPT